MTISTLYLKSSTGSFFYQYLVTLTGTIALISSGMHFGWPSPSIPLLLDEQSEIKISDSDGSWLAVMPSIGAAFGAVLGGVVVDIIGRKSCLLLLSPIYFVTWLVVAYAPSVIYLYVARFAVGTADGIAFTVFPMYVCEIADSNIRGMLGSSIQITIMIGFLVINGIGLHFSIQTTALVSSAIPVLHFLTFIWMPESPYFLIMKGKDDKAVRSLKTLKQVDNVDSEISRLNNAIKEDSEKAGSFMDLLTVDSSRNAVLVVCGLRTLQQLTGNNAIAFYCQTIFIEAGGSLSPTSATIIYFSGQLVIAILSSLIVDKTGRKPLLILSSIGVGISLGIEGAYFYLRNQTDIDLSPYSFVPLAALMFYIVMYNIGLNTIPTILLGEVFPTSIKAFALCVADIVFSLAVAATSKFFQITKDSFGMHVPFFTFAGCCVILLLFVIICVPETKGKTLEDVQLLFKSRNHVSEINPNSGTTSAHKSAQA